MLVRKTFPFLAALAALTPALADEHHWSPSECLDVIDAAEIDNAGESLDMAAFILTDRTVISALVRAAERGVRVRVVVDGRQRNDWRELVPISDSVRVRASGPFQHMKSFAVDALMLRSGSANFTRSGECKQENELAISRDPADAARFIAAFAPIWTAATPMDAYPPAVRAVEP